MVALAVAQDTRGTFSSIATALTSCKHGRMNPLRSLAASIAALGVVCLAPRSARASDAWWGADKALHFGVSVALSGAGYAASSLVFDEPWQRALAASAFSLSLGAAKETYDAVADGDPSWKDFAWDSAGTFVGTSVSVTVDVAFFR
jgi:putative lipoprotein